MKGGKFLDSYFSLQSQLFQDFSKKSVLLMQKGKFYEIYALPEDEKYFSSICNILGILQSRTDKSIPLSKSNPFMAGFPTDSINRHLKTLTENNYDVQIVDESKDNDSVITRNITRTVSKTTMIDDINNNVQYICYLIVLKDEMCIGLINLQLGEVLIYPEQKFDIDTIYEIISKYQIGELILHTTDENIKLNVPFVLNKTNPYLKISYKEEVLSKVYKKTIGQTIIESLGLERLELSSNLLTFMICYTLKYDPTLLRKISIPQIIYREKILHLPENAIRQLDIYDVIREIDFTTTPMGSRLLEKKIMNPNVENIKYQPLDLSSEYLRNIGDIDKLWSRISSTKANKSEIMRILESLKKIAILFQNINDKKITEITKKNLEKCIKYIEKRISKNDDEIFNKGYSIELDQINFEKEIKMQEIEKIRKEIHIYLNVIQTKDKIYFTCSNEHKKEIKSRVTASKSNKGWKIISSKSEPIFEEYLNLVEKSDIIIKNCLKKFCQDFSDHFSDFFYKLSKKVAQIDFNVCCSILINKYGYSIPIIEEKFTESFFEFIGLFHPISKNLISGFIPQDINLSSGMLLYGVNFSGKSTLLRSVGIAVILAQSGLPCPAKKMRFSPFSKLYSKISLGDNYIKGQSTFTNEIYEMKKMINNSDSKTLILADELCSGTEINSAVALVASCILSISKKNAKFIFTTHYHDLAILDEIKSSNTQIWHLSVERSDQGGFKFIRKLVKGKCGDIYGIEIAIHMDMNNEFIVNANKIRNKLLKNDIVSQKNSRYNSDVYMTECKVCKKRNSLHTHHIKFQKDFSSDDKTKNYKCNLIVLCDECHQKVHKREISITRYVETTEGIQIES